MGLNIPQIELLVIWVGGMHCVIVTKLCGARFFGDARGFKHAPPKVGGNKIIHCFRCHIVGDRHGGLFYRPWPEDARSNNTCIVPTSWVTPSLLGLL